MNIISFLDNSQLGPVNLNDIGILSKYLGEQMDHVRKVLTLLIEAAVTLKLEKCNVLTNITLATSLPLSRCKLAHEQSVRLMAYRCPLTVLL